MSAEDIDNCPEEFTFDLKYQVKSGSAKENYHICPITGLAVIQVYRSEDGILFVNCSTWQEGYCKSKKLLPLEDD